MAKSNTIVLQSIVFIFDDLQNQESNLFVTNTAPNAPIAGSMHEDTLCKWNHVLLPAEIHLYVAVYKYTITQNMNILQTVMLNSIEQLLELQNDNKVQLNEVYLFSPGNLNKSTQWKLERLAEIKQGNIYDSEEIATILELKNGNQYIDAVIDIKENYVNNIKKVFRSITNQTT